jgi:signal transduction histidine kinase
MMMTPRLRKCALTIHVILSVGWIGAVVGFLALVIAGLASKDAATVRAASPAIELTVGWVIVPFAFTSLGSGLVSSLFTPWGLFRYYWVLVKFVINVFACIELLEYVRSLNVMASMSGYDVLRASAALFALIVATVLSVYKPRGMTRYGWRKQHEERQSSIAVSASKGLAQESEHERKGNDVPAAMLK